MKFLANQRVFRRFDPRLSGELRRQRRSITIGLACVVVSNLFDVLLLPIIAISIGLISAAAPTHSVRLSKHKATQGELYKQAELIGPKLGIPVKTVETAFDRVQDRITDANTQEEAKLLAAELGIPLPEVIAAVSDSGNKQNGDIGAVEKLGWVCVLVVVIYACRYWFIRGQVYYLTRASARLTSDLRERLFAKLHRLPVSYFGDKRAGAIQSVLTNDVSVYSSAIGVLRDSIEAPVKASISLGFVIIVEWRLAVVTLLFLPAMAYIINRNGRKMKHAQTRVQDDLAEVSAVTTEALHGTRVIKAFSAEARMERSYTEFVESSYRSQLSATRIVASLRPLVEFTGATALATVLLVCGLLSYRGELELGNVAALMLALDRINQSLKAIGSVSNTYKQVEAASDRIYSEVLDVPDQVHEGEVGIVPASSRGRIEFKNVSFSYPDGTQALKNVSFAIEPSKSLALVGPSGAGKSTIADLMLRFYDPHEGQILFDGVNLRELSISWLRGQIGVVPQHTFLFAGSVAENIRMGKEDATVEEVREAAASAYAQDFILRIDGGFDGQLGESGIKISGGERQRIAIARALVRKPSLLLLDEATSALDATSEKAVTEALDRIMKERTTLFIAHRLTTAARADRILVLRKGEVIEEGSHTELMAQDGAYAGLFRAFSGGLLEA